MKKSTLLLFLLAMGSSWATFCLSSIFVLGRLQPLPDPDGIGTLPLPLSGMALTGMRVYGTSGCAACHTQQIRQLSVTSSDVTRLWGRRGSLVRDALSHPVFFPGSLRIGPDLTSYALRQQSSAAIHQLLYASGGSHSGMPAYPFLYEVRKIQGARSARALSLPVRPPAGYEVIPTYEAECLAAYLLSLKPTGLPPPLRAP